MKQFGKSVFVNCPFDREYSPILWAILFCILYLGFRPAITTGRSNSLQSRIDKIRCLISGSKYSIHDLSRCKSTHKEEYSRLNMPFELGMDFGCLCYGGEEVKNKKGLVFVEEEHSYDKAISDFSGFDVEPHGGSTFEALRKVRNWLVEEIREEIEGPSENLDFIRRFP